MSVSTVTPLNHTLEETHKWLEELAKAEPFQHEEQAYTILRAVLHSLRDRLISEEAAHLSSQLPMLVRGFYWEGWRPSMAPNQEDTRQEFLDSIRESLGPGEGGVDLEPAVEATLTFIRGKLSEGQAEHVKMQLPPEIEEMWSRKPG